MNTSFLSHLDLEETICSRHFDLEPLLPTHAPLLFASLQAKELYTYIPFEAPKTVEELEARYQRWSARGSADGQEVWLNYAICNRQKNKYVGTLQATVESAGKTYIAYEVFPPYWRCGIASEAVSALVNYLFNQCGVKVISAHTDTRNQASFKLLESLGFSRMDTLQDADFFKGETSHEYVYELSEERRQKLKESSSLDDTSAQSGPHKNAKA